jgi:hypothetical protein
MSRLCFAAIDHRRRTPPSGHTGGALDPTWLFGDGFFETNALGVCVSDRGSVRLTPFSPPTLTIPKTLDVRANA